jgi:hypothetical protein
MQEYDDIQVNTYLVDYFNETYYLIKDDFTALKWLNIIDTDTLNMLNSYIDNFELKNENNINEEEVYDFIELSKLICEQEKKYVNVDIYDIIKRFCILVSVEMLRRKGLCEILGDGKITDDNTEFILTEKGNSIKKGK